MVKSFLKSEFENGRAAHYILATTPVGILISFFLPEPFMSVIGAAFAFPVLFYFTRRGRAMTAFGYVVAWAMFYFVLVALLTALNPDYAATKFDMISFTKETAITAESWQDIARASVPMITGFIVSCGLSLLSGGAFFLMMIVISVSALAYEAGVLIHGGYFSAAILLLYPWRLADWAGQGVIALAAASIFYMRLERRKLQLAEPLRMTVLAVAFMAMSVYLYVNLGPTWLAAIRKAM